MPRPSHRLDLCIVPADPDREVLPAAARTLVAAWREHPPAGARHVRVDLPGEVSLYANQMGGFRVSCPVTGENVVPTFSAAVGRWRRGGPRYMDCAECGARHPFEELRFAPEAAFATGGVVLGDVQTAALDPAVLETAAHHLGGAVRVVARRVG